MPFTLSIGGDAQPFDDEIGSQLFELITAVARSQIDFLVLSNDETTEYVQCAEAYARLVVEHRGRTHEGWSQYRLCRRDGSHVHLAPRIEGYAGYEEREVLDVDEVAVILRDFAAGRPLSDHFELVDTTDELADAAARAAQPVEAPASKSEGLFGRLKRLFES